MKALLLVFVIRDPGSCIEVACKLCLSDGCVKENTLEI